MLGMVERTENVVSERFRGRKAANKPKQRHRRKAGKQWVSK